jgi:hypothetical protein
VYKMSLEFALDQKSVRIIETTLNIPSLDDVIDKDYDDHAPKDDNEREIAERFRFFNRGSARSIMRSFYTTEELEKKRTAEHSFSLP